MADKKAPKGGAKTPALRANKVKTGGLRGLATKTYGGKSTHGKVPTRDTGKKFGR